MFNRLSLRSQIVVALIAVYLIWGSTYLAIRFAIETIPPFVMGGVRFLIAGGALYAWLRSRGVPAPTRLNWRATAIVGGLLLAGGNGGVILAEELVPSSIAALIVAMVPVWMTLLNWKWGDRTRPTTGVGVGVVLGMIGIALIAAPASGTSGTINPIGVIILLGASLSWAIGSLYARRATLPSDPLMSTAMEMLAGGVLMLALGFITGQTAQVHLELITAQSLVAVAYLIVFGSLIGFTAYVFLLKVTTPAIVSTYAFVNPVVAVFLGWAFAGEALTVRTLIAAAVIVAAVVLITTQQSKKSAGQSTVKAVLEAEPQLAESA